MENPLNPSKYLGNELEYLRRVLDAESWSNTGGSWTQAFETQFAEKIGTKFGVAMNSGTSTLHAALLACGVECGDEVISPAITVIMDTTATMAMRPTMPTTAPTILITPMPTGPMVPLASIAPRCRAP